MPKTKASKELADQLTHMTSALMAQRRLKSGYVRRYHTVPHESDNQDIASHTWRMMVLADTLWPDMTKAGLMWIMYHDAGEYYVGDMPAPAKWKSPSLAVIYNAIEGEYMSQELNVHTLGSLPLGNEVDRCAMVDLLELVDHAAHLIKRGSKHPEAFAIYNNGLEALVKRWHTHPDFPPVKEYLRILREWLDYTPPLTDTESVVEAARFG